MTKPVLNTTTATTNSNSVKPAGPERLARTLSWRLGPGLRGGRKQRITNFTRQRNREVREEVRATQS